jgi:hypothetical protein
VQPPGLPVGDLAWVKDDGLAVLRALEGTHVAVLQVDAYAVPYGRQEVIHTGRRAGYLYRLGERASEFAERSRQSATDFISAGASDELFVLLFSDQDDAEAGHGTAAVRAG